MRNRPDFLRALQIVMVLSTAIFSGSSTLSAQIASDAAERMLARENVVTSELRALSQAMSKELSQVAVGAEADDAIGDLRAQRQRFGELFRELESLGQTSSTNNPEIELHLAGAQGAWPELDRMIGDAISWGHLTHYEFQTSQATARRLDMALRNLQQSYRRAAVDMGVHSVILNAIAVAEEQRVLSQEVPKLFILLLNGFNPSENRERLETAISEFDSDMRGLVEGSPERGLVAAPTPSIKADLQAAQTTWIELQATLRLESSGVSLDAQAIGKVSELSDTLYRQLDAAISGFRAL